jgi:hypothetical protein
MEISRSLIPVVAVMFLGGPACAEDADFLRQLPGAVRSHLIPGMHRATFGDATEAEVLVFDLDKNGLDLGDIDLLERAGNGERRAEIADKLLRYDLNGDLQVTAEEAATDVYQGRQPDLQAKQFEAVVAMDLDGNRIVTLEEALAPFEAPNKAWNAVRWVIQQDPDGDGKLTAANAAEIGQRAFDLADTDKDGVLSDTEAKAAKDLVADTP